jgi:hypothetical protein
MHGVIPISHKSGGPLYDFAPCGLKTYTNLEDLCRQILQLLSADVDSTEALSKSIKGAATKLFKREHFTQDVESILLPLRELCRNK